MPTYVNQDGQPRRDDGYDIEYYERTGGNEDGQDVADFKREIYNVRLQLNNNAKYSMISNVCIITLIGIILILNGIILLSLNFAQPGSTSRPSEGEGSKDIENYIKEIHCRLHR